MSGGAFSNFGVDSLRESIAEFALGLRLSDLDADTIHDVTLRVFDTVGALFGGFAGTPCGIARSLVGLGGTGGPSTVLGTTVRTSPDLAAFVNATTARYAEMNDVYHWPGSAGGHPSDVVMPVLAAAEFAHATGEEFIVAVVAAYEVYMRFADTGKIAGFDQATLAVIGSAVGAGRVLGLDAHQMRQCISMAVVPNNALRQARSGHLSMWKAAAAGQAGRSGVFAAMLAQAGMEGPEKPFEGTGGWLNGVARGPIELAPWGEAGKYKVSDTLIKPRSSCATTISSILAAEHAFTAAGGALDPSTVESVLVETYRKAKVNLGTEEHSWNPRTRETADHSIPYVVSAALRDGTVTPTQFDSDHLNEAGLQRIMERVQVVEEPAFTETYERHPVLHETRVTVRTMDGREFVGQSGGDRGDLSNPMSDADVTEKFHRVADPLLGVERANCVAQRLWDLSDLGDVASLPADLVVDAVVAAGSV